MMFKKITIVGFGLIGSSVAREIKKHKLSKFVSACDISSKHLSEIKKLKLADEVTANLNQSMTGSDLIIISTPLSAYKKIFVTIKKFANKNVLVSCQVGVRGHTATMLLQELGFNAVNLDGGYLTWSNSPAAEKVLVNQ